MASFTAIKFAPKASPISPPPFSRPSYSRNCYR